MTIPVTTLPLLLLLLSSDSSISYAKPPPPPTFAEQCPVILSKAIKFDTDATGGLNPTEFANFWSDLIGCGSGDEAQQQQQKQQQLQARDASDSQPRTASAIGDSSTDSSSKQIYNTLLCQCHYTFHHDLQCCDDTATADDDDAPTELAIREDEDPLEVWTEVSLEGFAEVRGGDDEVEGVEDIDMAKYSTAFCRNVIYSLEKQGIVLGEDFASGWNNAAITLEAGNSTEVEVVVIGGDETATTTTTTSSTTTTDAPETEATSTTTTPTRVTTVASTATTVATTKAPETTSLEAFDVTFVGSTNGKLTASSDDFEDVTIAFWTVSLDILKDMTTTRRRLNWDFGAEATVYFESVVMDVKDVGKCRFSSLLHLFFLRQAPRRTSLSITFVYCRPYFTTPDCSSGLDYVVEGSPCLQFTNTLTPLSGGPLSSPEAVEEFIQLFNTATNIDGKLYDALIDINPQTEFSGLGSPGKGSSSAVDETADSVNEGNSDASQQTTVSLSSEGSESKAVLVSGMPAGQIVLIVLAVGLVVNLVESNMVSEDIEVREVNVVDTAKAEEWADDEEGGYIGQVQSPTSSLAAMGVASTVATRLSTGDTEVMVMEKQPWTKNEPDV